MAQIRPFRAYRPCQGMEKRIAALPYDVYNREEACEVVKKNPDSFLAVDRAETQFGEEVDTYADCVYEKADQLLREKIQEGKFVQDPTPCFYLYELTMDGNSQTGVVACASIDDYRNNVIKKHENTRADKEEDRIHHVDTCSMQTGPIFLAYRAKEELQNKIKDLQGGDPTQVSGVQEVYDALIGAYDDYQKNKKADAADKLVKINADRLTSDVAKSCYDKIKKATYATATKKYFEEGRDAYNGTGSYSKKDYDKSIKLLEKSLSFDENNTDAIYFLGRCYQQKSDVEKAKSYYNKIVDNYPDSKRVSEAKRRLRELGE